MLRLPASPRARARLYRRAAVGAVLVVVAVLLAFFRNTGHSLKTPFVDKPARVVRTPPTVRATAKEKAEAERVLARFVETAVLRRNPASAWDLATPNLREGSTRREWAGGLLPVVPYPSSEFRTLSTSLRYSYWHILGYDVLVLPKAKSGEQRVYSCELRDLHGRWLVEWCYPRTTL